MTCHDPARAAVAEPPDIGRGADRRGKAIDAVLAIALPALLFCAVFPVALLDPTNIGWLLRGEDVGENALGLHAWLNDPAARGLSTGLLNHPDGVALLFTDSNPLLGVLLAPVARWLPADVQFVGVSYAAALVLHVAFARAILCRYAPSRAALWCGVALLSLLPALYVRSIHVNLFNHWLILAAIRLYVAPPRRGGAAWWALLLGAAALIHNYLLVMVGAVWGSALLERLGMDRSVRSALAVVAGALATVGLVAILLAIEGAGAVVLPTRTFGRFGMPIDAPWNPAYDAFSTLLPARPQAQDRQLEAFQYLGFGILALVTAIPLLRRRTRTTPAVVAFDRRLPWLLPALVALTLLALSNRIDVAGTTLATVPLPDAIIVALDPLRASARLFWPVAYMLTTVAIVTAYRLPARASALVVGGALALQIADLPGLAGWVRAQTAAATQRTTYLRTADPRWDPAIARARDITFVPGDATAALDLFQEVAWRAVDHHRPVRIVYAARANPATLDRVHAETRRFAAGDLDPGRLYVLVAGTTPPPQASGRVAVLDGVTVVLPVAAAQAR